MKISHLILSIIITLIGLSNSYGQSCLEFHKSKNCKPKNSDGFKLSSLSRGYQLEVGKTVTFEVVLYGDQEIILQCCTEDDFYPVRFKLVSSVNGDEIYDNKYNDYIDNLNLALDQTELIAIQVSVEPKKASAKGKKVCIGMSIYIEDTPVRN